MGPPQEIVASGDLHCAIPALRRVIDGLADMGGRATLVSARGAESRANVVWRNPIFAIDIRFQRDGRRSELSPANFFLVRPSRRDNGLRPLHGWCGLTPGTMAIGSEARHATRRGAIRPGLFHCGCRYRNLRDVNAAGRWVSQTVRDAQGHGRLVGQRRGCDH